MSPANPSKGRVVPGLPWAVWTALFAAVAASAAVPRRGYEHLTNNIDYQRWRWAFEQRAFPLGHLPASATEEKLRLLRETQQPAGFGLASVPTSGDQWINIGPAPVIGGQIGSVDTARPMSGRVTDIAVHPTNLNHWLMAAAGGGVWETLNAGATWTPKTDDQASLAMGAVAFAPSDPKILYVGTGEATFSGGAHAGAGLLRSTNGGSTWQLLATSVFTSNSFSDIKVNPTNASILLVATTRGFYGREGGFPPIAPLKGVFKSVNGGVNWTRKLTGEATDLEVHPTNFDLQFAALGEIFGNAATNGLYRSTNAGENWTRLAGPWTATPTEIGRVELALSPSDPSVLYVSIQNAFGGVGPDGGLLGLWRTLNAWDPVPLWNNISVAPTDNGSGLYGFCGWDPAYQSAANSCWSIHEIIVDPADPFTLYTGGVPLWKMVGSTWTEVSKTATDPANGIHVDQHCMAWAGSRLIVGNDGGVWSTTNGGSTWATHNSTLFTIQFYDGSLHPTNANAALAGSQDLGTSRWQGTNGWRYIWGGDGGPSAYSSTRPNTHWAISAQGLDLYRTLNAGSSISAAGTGIDRTGAPFIARLEQAPFNENILLVGSDNLWKCTNFFGAASPSWSAAGPEMGSAISAITFAPTDPTSQTYAFATADGQVRVTTNAGANWVNADGANTLPNRYVTDLAFHPTNANILYATLSGFNEGTPGAPGHLFRSTNARSASPTWVNISPPVNLPHNTLLLNPANPNIIYVGTDLGLWKSMTGGNSWARVGPASGMPNVEVFDLKANATTGRIMAFTYGRGAFALVDSNLTSVLRFTSITVTGATVRISFSSELNNLYRLERATTLPASNWTAVADNVPGTGGLVVLGDPIVSPPSSRFYRVRRFP